MGAGTYHRADASVPIEVLHLVRLDARRGVDADIGRPAKQGLHILDDLATVVEEVAVVAPALAVGQALEGAGHEGDGGRPAGNEPW